MIKGFIKNQMDLYENLLIKKTLNLWIIGLKKAEGEDSACW